MDSIWPDRAIGELAARQATMISTAQLHALGVSRASIAKAVRRGRLHRVHHGVYSLVAARVRPRRAAEHAALLACGVSAVLSHATAAGLHCLQLPGRPTTETHVTVPPLGPGRGRAGIRVHRTSDLPATEIVRRDGLRVTTIARTVVDCSAVLGPRALEALVDRALKQASRTSIIHTAERRRHLPGVPLLIAVLDPARPSRDTWSRTEARLLAMLVGAGLPAPEANVALGELVPDLLWREWRVIVGYDSDVHHFGPAGRRRTWERHNAFEARGFDVVHVTWDDLRNHPEQVLVRVTLALARGGWAPA